MNLDKLEYAYETLIKTGKVTIGEDGSIYRSGKKAGFRNGRGQYLATGMIYNDKPSSVFVHLLVYRAKVGKIPDPTLTVNHKDGDKYNNHPDNLELITLQDNNKHALELGLRQPPKKALDENTVKYIWKHKGRVSALVLARELGIGENTVRNIWWQNRHRKITQYL